LISLIRTRARMRRSRHRSDKDGFGPRY
jgi:hypothetical protein